MTNEPLIVDLEELKRVKEYLREINQTPFENIRWQINNHDVDMTLLPRKNGALQD
jgi:hypothetical protein